MAWSKRKARGADKISRSKVRMLIEDGWTDKRIAEFFEMTAIGYRKWKARYPNFLAKTEDWRIEASKKVERSLFKRATGFDYEEVEKKQVPMRDREGKRKLLTVEVKTSKKKMVGSVDAAKFILTNLQKERYKNRNDTNAMNMNGVMDDKKFADKFFGIGEGEEDDS